VFKLKQDRVGFGRLSLALWPLRSSISSWRRANPKGNWENALEEILSNSKIPAYQIKKSINDVFERLNILTSGHDNCPIPSTKEELIIWWKTPPP
jgi:hypothetical protein